jgi:predicted DNA-binding protein
MEGVFVAKLKIAITISPDTLERVDNWAEKLQQSRSQFILDQVETQLRSLEDEEVTKRYDEVYQSSEALEENRVLAEEMHRLVPDQGGDEKW